MTHNTLQRARGFTLMEMMITVAILLIVAAIAVPNYRNHVKRANRSDAVAALQRIAAAQEKFYLQNNTYTVSLGADGLDIDTQTRHYTLHVASADTDTFTATARPRAGQAQDTDCSRMTIDNQGRMVAVDENGNDTTSLCFR